MLAFMLAAVLSIAYYDEAYEIIRRVISYNIPEVFFPDRNAILKAMLAIDMAGIFTLIGVITWRACSSIGPGDFNRKQIDRINAIPAHDRFSFAVMGDSGHGYRVFKRILKKIDMDDYIFALVNGDLVMHGRRDNYRAFFNLIRNRKTPYLAAMGNHDLRHRSPQNFVDVFGRPHYSFAFGDSLFIIMNVAFDDRITGEQKAWAEEQLRRQFTHKFLFFHTPLFDPRPGKNHCIQDEANAREFMALLEKYRPDIVFNSHVHGYFDRTRNGVNYVVTGGAGQGLKMHGDSDEHHFHHYVKIDIKGDQVYKKVVPISFSESRRTFSLWMDGVYNFWVRQRLSVILYILCLIFLINAGMNLLINFTS